MASTSARATQAEAPAAGKWLITASIMFGTVLSVMDVSVVNVAMPYMQGTFGQDLLTITWVSTSYSIAEMIMITMTAWWSTLLGRKRLFLGSMALFTIGSVMAGTSQTFTEMLIWRVVQGTGGGALIPCSQAILRETFPPVEQGMAMAIYSMAVMLAPAAGPVVGGWLVDRYGWRWVFFINVPICVAGILMVSAFLSDPSYLKRGLTRIDWSGIALLSVWLATMQVVLERGQEVDWFSSHWIVIGTVIAGVCFVGLVIWELLVNEPVIDLRLLRNRELSVGSAIGAMIGFVLYGSTFLLPQLTQELLGYNAYQAGVVLLPRALVMLMLMPIIGRIYNHVSPRILTFVGLCCLIVSQWMLAHLSLELAFWSFLIPLVLLGIGLGSTMVPLSTVSLSTTPRTSMTGASALYTLVRRVAGNVAYAGLASIVDRREQFHHSVLATEIFASNPMYIRTKQDFSSRLIQFGFSPPDAGMRATALIGSAVNHHARIMAYNDANWACLMLALVVLPLVFLLPRRPPLVAPGEAAH